MHKGFIRTAFLIGAITVVMGAFGAHALKGVVNERVIATFDTAVRYQFVHVFALLFAGLLSRDFARKWLLAAGWLFITGLVLFCGSLYVLAYAQALVKPGFDWVGPVTPVGGLAFISGWVAMFIGTFKKQ